MRFGSIFDRSFHFSGPDVEQRGQRSLGAPHHPWYRPHNVKAVLTERYGDNDCVQLREIDPPRIGPKDLLVRVRAASINPLDSGDRLPAAALRGRGERL